MSTDRTRITKSRLVKEAEKLGGEVVSSEQYLTLPNGEIVLIREIGQVIKELGAEPDEVVTLESVLETTLTIIGFESMDGDHGEYLFIIFQDAEGTVKAFTTGAKVIMRRLKLIKAANSFPVSAIIHKIDDYYVIG